MKQSPFLLLCIFFGFALASCQPSSEVPEPASFELSLHPVFDWSEPVKITRTITSPDGDVNIEGNEVTAVYEDEELKMLHYPESDFPDQDFWRYYLGEETLQKLGYTHILAEEEDFDRQFIALGDESLHVLMLSNLVEFTGPFPDAPECPCKYTFTIFTNDRRIIME